MTTVKMKNPGLCYWRLYQNQADISFEIRYESTRLHGITSQKTVFLSNGLVEVLVTCLKFNDNTLAVPFTLLSLIEQCCCQRSGSAGNEL